MMAAGKKLRSAQMVALAPAAFSRISTDNDLGFDMRVKIECIPPLPSTKAWFIIPPVSSISEFKDALCTVLPGLRDAHRPSSSFVLSIDGFELLDTSSIDIMREGDLVTSV